MILHVEDNELVVSYVRRMLELKGWRVESCSDGEAALRKIEGDSKYDLIILDHQLPGVSGLELLRHAHSLPHRCQTPVVMYTCSDLEWEALAAGAPPPLLAKIAGSTSWSKQSRGWRCSQIRSGTRGGVKRRLGSAPRLGETKR